MRNHFDMLMRRFALPEDGKRFLTDAFDMVMRYEEPAFRTMLDRFLADPGRDVDTQGDAWRAIARRLGLPGYTVAFVFIACASEQLLNEYREAGIAEEVFFDTINDLACKTKVCHSLFGIWGLHLTGWFSIHFRRDLFILGRLQYEMIECYEHKPITLDCGVTVEPGQFLLNIHIPESGPLTREARDDSYRRAYQMFADRFPDGKLIGVCESWLLGEFIVEALPKRLNMVDFYYDFQITEQHRDPHYYEVWRVFDTAYYNGDPSSLQRDTTARRCFADYLAAGNCAGGGTGYLVFDGKNVLTRQAY